MSSIAFFNLKRTWLRSFVWREERRYRRDKKTRRTRWVIEELLVEEFSVCTDRLLPGLFVLKVTRSSICWEQELFRSIQWSSLSLSLSLSLRVSFSPMHLLLILLLQWYFFPSVPWTCLFAPRRTCQICDVSLKIITLKRFLTMEFNLTTMEDLDVGETEASQFCRRISKHFYRQVLERCTSPFSALESTRSGDHNKKIISVPRTRSSFAMAVFGLFSTGSWRRFILLKRFSLTVEWPACSCAGPRLSSS